MSRNHETLERGRRLPLRHPEYRYPESWNPYWKGLKSLSGDVYSDNKTEEHRGRWRERLPDSAQRPRSRRALHVEIGCNAGHVIIEWAARAPESAFIGVDWKFKQVFRAVEKARKRGIQNLVLLRAHAERLDYVFGDGEVDHLYLYFPDPWPKKSQWKNRFVTEPNLRLLARITRPGGTFEIRTDHPGYFSWMEEAISRVGDSWLVRDRTTDLHQAHPAPESLDIPDVTLFEKLFIRKGIRIHRLRLERI